MRCVEQKKSSGGVRIFKALERERLLSELRAWAANIQCCRPEVTRIGLFGSYARGDYSPGSDADVLILVRHCQEPVWFLRSLAYDTASLPVAVDLLVYTEQEARRLNDGRKWFKRVLSETLWLC